MSWAKDARIAVLLGGLSKEREVSFRTGRGMAQALRNRGFTNVSEIDPGRDLADILHRQKIEVAVIALHGRYGEDGTVQGLLEYLRIPYTGAGVIGSALAIHKKISKVMFESAGVPTPPWLSAGRDFDPSELAAQVRSELGFPAVAKPVNEGSTIGLSVVSDEAGVAGAQHDALAFDEEVLWEKFVRGTELTVGFLSGAALPVVEIVPKKGLFDYEAKYTKGMTDYYCPARIPEAVAERVKEVAVKAFLAVACESFGRVDLILEGDTPWVLEVNTIPGMTETSLVPKAARAAGISYDDAVERILQEARLKA
jgi:D-alanine-D-alanine ligase